MTKVHLVAEDVGVLYAFVPSLFTLCNLCLSSLLHGGSWLCCQDLPTMEAGSWMSQVPNLHLAMQLVNPSIMLNTDIQEEDQAYRVDIDN